MSGDAEILLDDPDQPGRPFVMWIRELPGAVIAPHSHPVDEHITVVQGVTRLRASFVGPFSVPHRPHSVMCRTRRRPRWSLRLLALLLAAAGPAAAQSPEPGSGAASPVFPRPGVAWPLFADGRLVPPPSPPESFLGEASASRWPQDPAVGGLLGGAIGCAAGWLLFILWDTKEASGNDPAWGCLTFGVIGWVLGGQQEESGRRFFRPGSRPRGTETPALPDGRDRTERALPRP